MRMPNLFRIARVPLQPKASVSESLSVQLRYCATDSSPTSSPHAIPLYAWQFNSYKDKNNVESVSNGIDPFTPIKRSEDRPDLLTLHATISLSTHTPFTLRGTRGEPCYSRNITIRVKGNASPRFNIRVVIDSGYALSASLIKSLDFV